MLIEDRKIRVRDEAMNAFTPQRAQYTAACWHPEPGSKDLGAGYNVTLSFDGSGHETNRNIEATDLRRSSQLECVRRQSLSALRITPPGQPVDTTLTLVIP